MSGPCSLGEPIAFGFSVWLVAVASVWLALWLVYLPFVIRFFPKVQTPRAASLVANPSKK
jgi:hypothetical protein